MIKLSVIFSILFVVAITALPTVFTITKTFAIVEDGLSTLL